MGFGDDLKLFAEKVERRHREVFVGALTTVHESVTEGSAITGAPGQPVGQPVGGNLRRSWIMAIDTPGPWLGETATNVVYAPAIEEGQQQPYTTASGTYVQPRPMTLRSQVGGFHSVKLTRSNWDRIVERTLAEVVR